jgi:hypothetical protein
VIGAPLIGGWIAQLAFWVLLALGMSDGTLSRRAAPLFVALWLVGHMGLTRIAWWAGPLATSWVAVLDVALVLLIFKKDVRLG